MNQQTKAILFTFLTFVGLGGIGHFYLGRFKQGLLLLLSNFVIHFIGVIVGLTTAYYDMGTEQLLVTMQMYSWISAGVVFGISLTHIIHILRKNNG